MANIPQSISEISLFNNSTTVLGSGASFTGTGEDVTGYSSIIVNIDSDLVGTLAAQFSQNGTNWTIVPRTFFNVSNGQTYTFIPAARYFRVFYTNATGTQSFFRLQTIFKSNPIGEILAPANTPLTPNSLAKTVISLPNDGVKTTYTASISNSIPAALTPTDVYVVNGSATKTIRISKVLVSGTRTTPTQTDIVLIKRSTANTLGTSTNVTPAANDSLNPLPTAVVKAYTANPTVGTSVGLVYSVSLFIPGVATSGAGGIFSYEFGRLGQTIVLRGVNESLAINLAGVTIAGGSFNYTIEWTEE